MSKSKVYFTKTISPEKMIDMVKILNSELPGKVAIKLHSGEVGNQNFLRPEFMQKIVEKAKEDGFVATEYGRRRALPELKSSNFNLRSFGERVALNAPIQGTAADIIKIAMNSVSQELRKRGLNSRLILQIHDELIVEGPENEAGE